MSRVQGPAEIEESLNLSPDVELQPEIIRYHGLDALRALAMAMGIVLHAALPYFFTGGFWPSSIGINKSHLRIYTYMAYASVFHVVRLLIGSGYK